MSGVACAYFLKKYNPKIYSVIYEAEEFLGGRAYSQYDDEWNMYLNNSAHMVLGSDKFMKNFVKEDDWRHNIFFVDMHTMQGSSSINNNLDIVCRKVCNTDYDDTSQAVKARIKKIFNAKNFNCQKFYTFNCDLNQRVINVLAAYADEVHCSCELTKISSRKDHATTLHFGQRQVKLNPKDKVILALDNANAASLLGLPLLEQNSSVNISYYTSQTIFLPQGVSFVGVRNGVTDWITTSPNIISAQICNYEGQFNTLDKLALYVWGEISQIRGVNSAFVPPYRIELNKAMSINLDEINNAKRPNDATTQYDNVFICGDWTMKNYPCTLETAAISCNRAVKAVLNS